MQLHMLSLDMVFDIKITPNHKLDFMQTVVLDPSNTYDPDEEISLINFYWNCTQKSHLIDPNCN